MSEEAKRYNGYVNYETWCVHLWLTNDEGSDSYWREAAAEAIADAPNNDRVDTGIWSEREAAKFALADRLKDEMNDGKPDLGASVWADLLGAALDECNWHEVAEAFLDDDDDYKALANETGAV